MIASMLSDPVCRAEIAVIVVCGALSLAVVMARPARRRSQRAIAEQHAASAALELDDDYMTTVVPDRAPESGATVPNREGRR